MDNTTANPSPQERTQLNTHGQEHVKKGNAAVGEGIMRDGTSDSTATSPRPPPKKSIAFWSIILALAFSGLLTSLEATIVSTALPTIINVLGGADLYIWVVNIYFLTMTSVQPLFGQLANIFGRRWPMIFATATFTLGSGISGGASNMTMLLAGRAIQGIGAGGINVLIEVIVCDLLPLRERGHYLAIIFGLIAVGTALGPVFGGLIVQYSSWRWVFYINLPVGGLALILLTAFLQVNYDKETKFMARLKRIDWIGNLIFILSMVSILIALSWAGAKFPWSSFHIIVPLILGLLGFASFLFYESSRFCIEPTMPIHLFRNRTSMIAFVLTFLHSVATIAVIYFMPVYFQGVLNVSPARSGVNLLPTILLLIPFAATAGAVLAKFGRYRPLHHAGFALMITGFGLFTSLNAHSSVAEWVIYQGIGAAGAGLIIPVLLPAVQASLTEADTALATSTWAFVRSFGLIWGATIPAAVFNNRVNTLIQTLHDPEAVALLSNGNAYEHATKAFLNSISDLTIRNQVIGVFAAALKTVWYVSIAFASLAFVLVILEKEVTLRKEIETEFGMVEKKRLTAENEPISKERSLPPSEK